MVERKMKAPLVGLTPVAGCESPSGHLTELEGRSEPPTHPIPEWKERTFLRLNTHWTGAFNDVNQHLPLGSTLTGACQPASTHPSANCALVILGLPGAPRPTVSLLLHNSRLQQVPEYGDLGSFTLIHAGSKS
ncbi:hypothetical protein IMZ48_37300 [Candidatus Bathyarchaeota archaeon]|nr:hypothetical protein [Candidatus Bathyarchaeota archaeon]